MSQVGFEDLLEGYLTLHKIAKQNVVVFKTGNTSDWRIDISVSHSNDHQKVIELIQDFLVDAKQNHWTWAKEDDNTKLSYIASTDHKNDHVSILQIFYPSKEVKQILEENCKDGEEE